MAAKFKLPGRAKATDHYCDIAGYSESEPVFFAYDASECTIFEVEGVKTILSEDEFERELQLDLVGGIASLFKSPGHQLTVTYETSSNVEDDLGRIIESQRHNAALKRLDVSAIVDEGEEIIRRRSRRERILVALWTNPAAGIAEDVKLQQAENKRRWAELPPAKNAQSPFVQLAALDGPHTGAVKRLKEAFDAAQIKVRTLGPDEHGRRRDLSEVRKALLYRETPDEWSPIGTLDRTYPGAKETLDDDTSELFAPPIAQQIMSASAKGSSNLRTVAFGGRQFAIMAFKVFPRTILHFSKLLEGLLALDRETVPFRISFHVEDLGKGGDFTWRKVVAGLTSFTSPSTNNLFRALQKLQVIHEKDRDTLVRVRLLATTWVEPGEPAELLERRRSVLMRALTTWGDAVVMEAPHDPLRALTETVAGMNMRARVPPATIAPMSHAAALLPFHRQAKIFDRGETIFLTPDGKLMPHEAHSSDQSSWLTLIGASPGSGKSVLINRLNHEFAAYSSGSRLPFVCVIDVGVSSRGFVDLIKSASPADLRHQALYVRLQNDEDHAVNMLQLGLGRRQPLPREATVIEAFLDTLLDLRAGNDPAVVQSLIARIIDRLFSRRSDLSFVQTDVAKWQPNVEPLVDRVAREQGINLRQERTTWWQLVDEFTLRGLYREAQTAQRRASPRLDDIAAILAEQNTKTDFPADFVQKAARALEAAVKKYPIFSNPTALDIAEARVISIDLQDVSQRNRTAAAHRNNTLFFLAAQQCFMSRIGGNAEELRQMVLPQRETPGSELYEAYAEYWRRFYADVGQTRKRLVMDEFSLTASTDGIRKIVEFLARESRKWGMELALVSQFFSDFAGFEALASAVFILNPDSAEARNEAQRVFGFSDAVLDTLTNRVTGPVAGKGANLLAGYTLKDQRRWALLTNLMGPRLLWALTTVFEDRAVRDELYTRLSMSDALTVLAERYPTGSALEHWDRVKSSKRNRDDEVAKIVVGQIMGDLYSGPVDTSGVRAKPVYEEEELG